MINQFLNFAKYLLFLTKIEKLIRSKKVRIIGQYPALRNLSNSIRIIRRSFSCNQQGKMREYKIGTMLRKRYDQYLGPDYWPAKIYARSTEVPRTQMSLQLVLAGLFPPSEKQTWNPHLPWIPTWTVFVPYKIDTLLFPQYCYR